MVVNLIVDLIHPQTLMALTAGSASPEFASFEPVATTDMVNEFTGDFTYNLPVLNVPGPDGGGYALSLSYHSGVSSEEEASWVGYGWTLNPGAINRNVRGYPDDFKRVKVEKYQKVKPNWTQSATFDTKFEFNSSDRKPQKKEKKDGGEGKKLFFDKLAKKKDTGGKPQPKFDPDPKTPNFFKNEKNEEQQEDEKLAFSVSLSKTVRFNNYSGFSIANNFGGNVKGMGSINLSRAGGRTNFSINPLPLLAPFAKNKKISGLSKKAKLFGELQKVNATYKLSKKLELTLHNTSTLKYSLPSIKDLVTYNTPTLPYSVAYNVGRSFNFRASAEINPAGPLGFQIGIQGNFNTQANIPQTDHLAYGYMYNPGLDSLQNRIDSTYYQHKDFGVLPIDADFQVEKATTFNKHDRNLGIPFNNADVFSATGNAVVGGFRFHHNTIGHYYPNFLKNTQSIFQLGVELGIGQTIQIGLDLGLGLQETKVGPWRKVDKIPGAFPDPHDANYPLPFLQFTNDSGGRLRYNSEGSDSIFKATVDGKKKLDLSGVNDNRFLIQDPDTLGQTSYLEYSRYDENGNLQQKLDKSIPAAAPTPANQVAQIAVTDENGAASIYGLPVYTRKNKDLSIGLQYNFNDGAYLAHDKLYYDDPLKNRTVSGQYIEEAYATSYLLTQTTTFDYVDANGNNQADEADFGGWTRFHYRQKHGAQTGEWYRYRAPYTGLLYNRGRLFDKRDQTGGMSSGEKEVYYCKAIETKSHLALFITNETDGTKDFAQFKLPPELQTRLRGSYLKSGDKKDLRYDGLDAAAISSDGMDPAAADKEARGEHRLEKLERIVLIAKSDFSVLSTTFFDYDYSLCQQLPNSLWWDIDGGSNNTGKLTLKRVWTESEGMLQSKISPFQFFYNYFKQYPPAVVAKYPEIELISDHQNPNYNPHALDMWGNYQLSGEDRFRNMIPWVSQKNFPDNYDPAPWSLKRIVLPSGGEIHVQYEQKNYRYVQDREATVMINLLPEGEDGYRSDKNKFYINTDFIDLDPSDLESYKKKLESYFVSRRNKLYFKMLYAYTFGATSLINAENVDRLDYITGYTDVNEVGIDIENGKIFFKLGEIKPNGNGKRDRTLSRYVCYEKLLTSSGRNLGPNADKWDEIDDKVLEHIYSNNGTDIMDKQEKNKILRKLARKEVVPGVFRMFGNWVGGVVKNPLRMNACKEYQPKLSYFKLPVPDYNGSGKDLYAKQGGGARVKRLLAYDQGMETGDAMVYGTRYYYEMPDGSSSGVATNEPPGGREENALVTVVERNKQKWLDKHFNGRDSKVFEGPLGESLLPAASIAYERVVAQNIHTGKSTTGYRVSSFHTVREHPTVTVSHSDISKDNDTYKKFNLSLPLGIINFDWKKAWVTQGYLFKISDMHGKPKSQTVYPGVYDRGNQASSASSSYTYYNYSKPGEAVNTLVYDPATSTFYQQDLSLGEEEDITMFLSEVNDVTNDFNIEIDANIMLPAAVSLGFGISYSYAEQQLNQHVTSRVLRQKSYLLYTETISDGVTQRTETAAFDRYTGEPVLTRTYDGYTAPQEWIQVEKGGLHAGYYYNLNLPAYWIYEDMGPKSQNASRYKNQLRASAGSIVTYGDPFPTAGNAFNMSASPIKNVVSASATLYADNWFGEAKGPNPAQPYLSGFFDHLTANEKSDAIAALNKHYYPKRTYVWRDGVTDANDADHRLYNGGLINEIEFFKYLDPNLDSDQTYLGADKKWFSPGQVVYYSPNGFPLQERDALGIESTAKFGYAGMLPVLVAQNSDINSVHFIDFEQGNVQGFNLTDDMSHSGLSCFNLSANPNQIFLDDVPLTQEMKDKGASLKLWLRSRLSNQLNDPKYGLKNPNPNLRAVINGQFYPAKAIAQTGDWTLYEARIADWTGLAVQDKFDVRLLYGFLGNEEVLIDDLRFQPLESIMNCTVYYPDFKVAAQFDDQHFATFYEYNDRGQLTRKSIETERGRKTLQEQQYNLPTVARE